ncbi:MAG: polysaccharide biosynthesis tyrosine autokinase [Pseudomonadota bacterium]
MNLRPRDHLLDEAPLPIDADDRVDLAALTKSVWRRKWMIIAAAVLGAVVLYLYAATLPEKFTARAFVMLDPREQQVISSQELVVGDLELNNPILENEVAILRSSVLLEEAIAILGVDRFAPLLSSSGAFSLLSGSTSSEPPSDVALLEQVKVALRDGLRVSRMGESYIIEIASSTVDAELSALVANTIGETYINRQLAERRRVAESATSWLAGEVEAWRVDLVDAERRVEVYKRSQLDAVGTSPEVLESQLAELIEQLALARSDLATEEARLAQLDAMMAEHGPAAVAATSTSSFLGALRIQAEELVRQDRALAVSLGPKHPERILLAEETARLEAVIAGEVENITRAHRSEIEVLRTRVLTLSGSVEALETQIADISSSSIRLRQFEREADAARASYEDLLARLGEARAQVELQRSEAQFLSTAKPPTSPSAPRPKLMAAFGGALGLTGGLVAAVILHFGSSGFVQRQSLEMATRQRVLSVLPTERISGPGDVGRLFEGLSYSLFAQRIRQLRTVLSLSETSESQSILVISSAAGEGKTTTSLALAEVFGLAGGRTILINLDPQGSPGALKGRSSQARDLANYLVGAADLDQVIENSEGGRYDLASLGRDKDILSDSLSHTKFRHLLAVLKERYDTVLIDSPPILSVSDGLPIAATVDKVLYLVRSRKTPRAAVLHGLAMLRSVNVRSVGLVLTMAEVGEESSPYGAADAQ